MGAPAGRSSCTYVGLERATNGEQESSGDVGRVAKWIWSGREWGNVIIVVARCTTVTCLAQREHRDEGWAKVSAACTEGWITAARKLAAEGCAGG